MHYGVKFFVFVFFVLLCLVLEFANDDLIVEGNAVHAHIEAGAEEKDARELAMNRIDLLGRRAETMRHHGGYQGSETFRCILFAKIKGSIITEDLAQYHDSIDMRLFHLLGLVAGEESHLARHVQHSLAIILRRTDDHLAIVAYELMLIETRRTEVNQHEAPTLLVVQEVRPIRIRLHALDLEEFAQAELQHGAGNMSAMFVAERD